MHAQNVRTNRLELVSLGRAFLIASLEGRLADAAEILGARVPGEWPGEASGSVRRRLEQIEREPDAQPWLMRAIVVREPEPRMVGYVNFHAPPGPRAFVEIGYRIFPDDRRRGYAEEAARGLLDWASRQPGVRRFRASVRPTNEPSLRLIEKLGFQQVSSQWDDEDGVELVFERPARQGDASFGPTSRKRGRCWALTSSV